MMKKLFLFTLLISSLLIVGCGNNVSDPTNDGGTVVESSYKANGISSVYEGKGYKFFSMDGNTYQITIKDGGISGLGTYSFDKSSIYSKNADGDDDYTGTYKEYIVYNNSYNGIIMFSKTDDNVGTIYLKNTDGTIIEGFIDIDRTDRVIPTEYKGTWQRQNISGSTVSVTIDDTFVTYYSSAIDRSLSDRNSHYHKFSDISNSYILRQPINKLIESPNYARMSDVDIMSIGEKFGILSDGTVQGTKQSDETGDCYGQCYNEHGLAH